MSDQQGEHYVAVDPRILEAIRQLDKLRLRRDLALRSARVKERDGRITVEGGMVRDLGE
jgi:hypothetical protein